MVSNVAEAPSTPVSEGVAKTDQASGGGFMAMLTGLVSAQPGHAGQGQEKTGKGDAGAASTGADLAGAVAAAALAGVQAALSGAQAGTQAQQPVDGAKIGQSQAAPKPGTQQIATQQLAAQQVEVQAVDPAQIKQPETTTKAATAGVPSLKTEAKAEATLVSAATPSQTKAAKHAAAEAQTQAVSAQAVSAQAVPARAVPTQAVSGQEASTQATAAQVDVPAVKAVQVDPDKQAIAEALQSLTTQRAQAKALPEAARPDGEIAATLVAAKLNGMGQNSQSGALLLGNDGQSQTQNTGSDKSVRNVAAAVAGSKKPEPAPADTSARIQVEWKPSEPVTINTSSGGGFRDALGFAKGNTGQSEPKDLSAENTSTQQAFGAEMKAQLGTQTVVRQAQSAPAQAPQIDPTLGEKMVGQIVKEVSLHKLGENTTLSIRLDPPELGSLRVSVTSQSGVLTTQLESPNAVVRGILETHLPALKDALANAGVEVSKFSVSSGTDFGQNAQRQQQAWQPTRFTPAVEFNPDAPIQAAMDTATGGNQTSAASNSWLA